MVEFLEQYILLFQGPSQAGVFVAQLANQADFLGGLQNRQTQLLAGDAVFHQVVLCAGSHSFQGHPVVADVGEHHHREGRFVERGFQVQLG